MNALTQTALSWVGQGIGVIPAGYMRKEPDVRALKRAGSSDGDWKDYQTRLPSAREVECMFISSLTNLAVITGWQGLVVLDFDDRDTFFGWWARYPIKTYMVLTARGVHVYVLATQPASCKPGKGLDIKAAGGYVLAPPSIHPSRLPYTVLWDAPIVRVDSIEELLPADLLPTEQPKQQPQQAPARPAVARVASDDPWDLVMNADKMGGRDVIQKIKARFTVEQILSEAGLFRPEGGWSNGVLSLKCAFHDDHSHSGYIVAPESGYRKNNGFEVLLCRNSSCPASRGLDVLNLYERIYGIDEETARRELGRRL